MPPLDGEWTLWSLVNGLPGLLAVLAFLLYPPFDRKFAWDVLDRRSGIFFGVAFLMRGLLFAHVINAGSWGEIRWLLAGNLVFVGELLVVTLVWGDLFRWRRLTAIAWLLLYVEEPIWMLTLVPQAQAAFGNAVLAGGPVLPLTKAVLWLEAGLMLAVSAYLWFLPKMDEARWWPWKPDLVSARIMVGFTLGWVLWSLTLAAAPSWEEARGGVLIDAAWLGSICLSTLVFHRRFDWRHRATRAYVLLAGSLTVLLAIVYLQQGQA